MSSLTNDLQKIYLTKLQIKEVIGTDSDVFEDYPELISDAISEGGGGSGEGLDWDDVAGYGYIVPAGTYNITQNGTFDISAYASTYVDVPQEGGEAVVGHINITSNGTFIASEYSGDDGQYDGFDVVYVDVPQDGITPTGTYNVTVNGNYDISTYASVNVNVPTGGGSGGYETHTVSDVVEFENDSRYGPYMWDFMANELDGEDDGDPDYAHISAGCFTTKYWSYCYPTEFEIEMNPILDMDGEPGMIMTSYTDLVKREYDFNSLPDFNTYRGYTYSYQYLNPDYDPEIGNVEYLTYEYNYGADLLYSTTLNIAKLSDRVKEAPNEIINGVYKVFDDDNPGLTGYYNETEMGEGNYANKQNLSIGCLSPADTRSVVTQFTTTYHGAASYTTGFNPYDLCGYVWSAVVDGRGWLVDLISNDGDLVFSEMRLSDGDDENAAYLTSDRDDFIQEIELRSDSNTVFDGLYIYAVDDSGDYTKNYKLNINSLYGDSLLNNGQITVGASCTGGVSVDNASPNLYVDMGVLSNYYSEWQITLELVIPNRIVSGSQVMLRVTDFTDTLPTLTVTGVYSQGSSSNTQFVDQGDGTWLEADVRDALYPGRVIYEVYDNGTSQAYQVSSWDSTNEVLQFVPGDQRDFTQYGESGWDWLWDTEAKTLSHVSQ